MAFVEPAADESIAWLCESHSSTNAIDVNNIDVDEYGTQELASILRVMAMNQVWLVLCWIAGKGGGEGRQVVSYFGSTPCRWTD